jgi:hypothetical protein
MDENKRRSRTFAAEGFRMALELRRVHGAPVIYTLLRIHYNRELRVVKLERLLLLLLVDGTVPKPPTMGC